MIQRGLIGNLFTLTRSVIETGAGKYKPLLTLCDALLRMFAGLFADPVDILALPEVLIGEFLRYALRTERLTPTCADAQVFLF